MPEFECLVASSVKSWLVFAFRWEMYPGDEEKGDDQERRLEQGLEQLEQKQE